MTHMRRLFLSALLLGFLAGCAGLTGVSTVSGRQNEYWVRNFFTYAASGRDLRTVIRGSAFDIPKAEFDAAVIAHMPDHNWNTRTNFTTTPSETARENFFVVMVFNPPINFDGDDACAGAWVASEPRPDEVRVRAAFCGGYDYALSDVAGRARGLSGVDDPRFGALIRQVTLELFPLFDTERPDRSSVFVP